MNYLQNTKTINTPYINPAGNIVEPIYSKPMPSAYSTLTLYNTSNIKRNKTIQKFNKMFHSNTVDKNYSTINPYPVNQRSRYTMYNSNNMFEAPNFSHKTYQSQTFINTPVNNLSLTPNVITSVTAPNYINTVNNLSVVPNVVNTVNTSTIINDIIPNQSIITTATVPTYINEVQPNPTLIPNESLIANNIGNLMPNQSLIAAANTPTIINEIKPSNNIITFNNPTNLSNNFGTIIPNQEIFSTINTPNIINSSSTLYNVTDINSHSSSRNRSNSLIRQKQGYNQKVNYISSINSSMEPGEMFNLSEFKIVNEIGKGTFGKIYKVLWVVNNKFYALKKEVLRDIEGVKVRQHRNQTIRNFIRTTNCQGVVNIYGNFCVPRGNEFHNFELMELCERDFEQEIRGRAAFNRFYTEIEFYNVMLQLIQTLSFLQKSHITHRDIKPQNILISNGIYKLCDFGDIRFMQREGIVVQRVRGSELYMSPILFNGLRAKVMQVRHNTYKSDVFSLGMCLLLAACLSYDGLVEIRELSDMKQKEMILIRHLSPRYSPKIINILVLMLQTEEANRPDFILLESIMRGYGL